MNAKEQKQFAAVLNGENVSLNNSLRTIIAIVNSETEEITATAAQKEWSKSFATFFRLSKNSLKGSEKNATRAKILARVPFLTAAGTPCKLVQVYQTEAYRIKPITWAEALLAIDFNRAEEIAVINETAAAAAKKAAEKASATAEEKAAAEAAAKRPRSAFDVLPTMQHITPQGDISSMFVTATAEAASADLKKAAENAIAEAKKAAAVKQLERARKLVNAADKRAAEDKKAAEALKADAVENAEKAVTAAASVVRVKKAAAKKAAADKKAAAKKAVEAAEKGLQKAIATAKRNRHVNAAQIDKVAAEVLNKEPQKTAEKAVK
jgi:hypothetical protein